MQRMRTLSGLYLTLAMPSKQRYAPVSATRLCIQGSGFLSMWPKLTQLRSTPSSRMIRICSNAMVPASVWECTGAPVCRCARQAARMVLISSGLMEL